MIHADLPLKIISVMNQREHWGTRQRRARDQRRTAWAVMLQQSAEPPTLRPLTIILTRVHPVKNARPLDTDNLAAAFKAVRDGIADWLKVDDGDPQLSWRYAQRVGEKWKAEVVVVPAAQPGDFRWWPGSTHDAPGMAGLPVTYSHVIKEDD